MRVVICGAGIAGLMLANRLATTGLEVVLLERAPRLRAQGYMIDFFGPGYDAMSAMGLLWLRRAMLRFIRLPLINRTAATAIAGKSTALIDNLRQDLPSLSGRGDR